MALAEDNHIDPNNKARWGFGGNAGKITVGPQTVGETGGVESVLTEPDNSGAHNNGGGTGDGEQVKQLQQANAQLAAEKEVEELKAKLDAAGVTYRANASKESLQKLVEDLPK